MQCNSYFVNRKLNLGRSRDTVRHVRDLKSQGVEKREYEKKSMRSKNLNKIN